MVHSTAVKLRNEIGNISRNCCKIASSILWIQRGQQFLLI